VAVGPDEHLGVLVMRGALRGQIAGADSGDADSEVDSGDVVELLVASEDLLVDAALIIVPDAGYSRGRASHVA
jgi:hypothetical protein